MSKADIRSTAEAIFAELLAESVLTTTIEAHREIKRGQAICSTCGTRCRAHVPIQPLASGSSSAVQSRESSPAPGRGTVRPGGYAVGPEKGTGGGTGIGSGSGRVDSSGNAFFDCLVCGRSITSSRYAPHLASCLGFSGSTRRGASRMAAAKARLGANDRASPSPYLASENDSDADSTGGGKRRKMINGSAKRHLSPSKASLKKKLGQNVHSGSAPPSSRAPHPPSRLGRPPTTSKAHSASPFSPEKSGAVSAPTSGRYREGSAKSSKSAASTGGASGSGSVASHGGGVGAKTLPTGMASAAPPPGDESSEADDDY